MKKFIFLTLFTVSFTFVCKGQDNREHSKKSNFDLEKSYSQAAKDIAMKQRQIDSLISIGENMFYAAQPILFKYVSSISGPSELINKNDILILVQRENDRYYKVEWDNKIGFIFQFDIEPYDILSADHYLQDNPVADLNQSVRLDTFKSTSTNSSGETKIANDQSAPELSEKTPDAGAIDTKSLTISENVQPCIIQIFASKYDNKIFPNLKDLGNVIANKDPKDQITRYRINTNKLESECNQLIIELENRGFPGCFKIY